MGDIDKELEKETKAQSSDENKGEVVFATTPHKENSGSSTVLRVHQARERLPIREEATSVRVIEPQHQKILKARRRLRLL